MEELQHVEASKQASSNNKPGKREMLKNTVNQ